MRVDRLQSPDVAPSMSRDADPPVGVERHPIRPRLRPSVRLRPLVSAGMQEDGCALVGTPLINVVGGNLGKHQRAIVGPDRPFEPFVKTGGDALQLGIGRHNLIDRGVEFLEVPGEGHAPSQQQNQEKAQLSDLHPTDCSK